ncbi:MAG UNVERIFIED_CONTAM: hypothetical protein LVR18_16595 [Planctomycetaceae bacterium]
MNRAPMASGGCQSPGNDTANARVCRVSNADTGIAVACAIANAAPRRGVTGRLPSAARPEGRGMENRIRDAGVLIRDAVA